MPEASNTTALNFDSLSPSLNALTLKPTLAAACCNSALLPA